MDESEQDKSEQPTAYKLSKAREKGSVARGADLGFLASLSALVATLWIAGPRYGAALLQATHDALNAAGRLAEGNDATLAAMGALALAMLAPLALLAAALFAVVLLFEIVQTGVVFSADPLKPDFSRLDPAKGIKRLFSLRMLIETGKNVLKLVFYSAVAVLAIRAAIGATTGASGGARALGPLIAAKGFNLLFAFLGIAALFAALDQLIARRDFLKRMRMSRRDIRREARDREGEPRLKQKRKQMHAEFVKASQSLRGLRGADVLITNPQHIALALRYDPRTMQAPLVVASGTDHLAQRLKRLAFIYAIPIVENRPLARLLQARSEINRPIPPDCFRAVADIYNTLRRSRAKDENHV
jgi:flagellar biosynthetic protein FlhB